VQQPFNLVDVHASAKFSVSIFTGAQGRMVWMTALNYSRRSKLITPTVSTGSWINAFSTVCANFYLVCACTVYSNINAQILILALCGLYLTWKKQYNNGYELLS
jgi:hypothetical protein